MQIKSLLELKKLAKNGIEIKLILNFGLKSVKWVRYAPYGWHIENHIDNSEQICKNDRELDRQTNIVRAIKKGALFLN